MRLPFFLIDWIWITLVKLVARRPPDVVIGNDYLRRWWVIPRNRFFNIYFHQFLRSDDDRALHDHPWWSCSIILRGGYFEVLPTTWEYVISGKVVTDYQNTESVWRPAGSVIFRKAEAAHRVMLEHLSDGEKPAWTLFITGPRIREWGFYCKNGWRDWRVFTNYRSGDSTSVGPGCDP